MDYTYVERQKEASYRCKGDTLPSGFFHSNLYLGFQEDAVGIRLRDAIGVESVMWCSDYPHAESTFPRSRQILDTIMKGVPHDERSKMVGGHSAKLYSFDLDRVRQA